MSAFYDDIIQQANDLLTEFGQVIPCKRVNNTFDGITGAATAGAPTTQNVTGAVLNVNSSTAKKLDDTLKAALVAGRLRRVLISPANLTFEPTLNDILTFQGSEWDIKDMNLLNPAGQLLLITAIVERRGAAA